MIRDGLVEVPENAMVEERIALGLTAQFVMASPAGFEPATRGLEDRRSVH